MATVATNQLLDAVVVVADFDAWAEIETVTDVASLLIAAPNMLGQLYYFLTTMANSRFGAGWDNYCYSFVADVGPLDADCI